MKRYKKYKPSGVKWLPEIPAHWEMSKAKYYFQYTTGFTPPTGVAEFYNGDITWITIADMNQKIVFDSATKLSQTAIDKYTPDLTLKGSLLYSFKLSVGKVAYAGKALYTNEAIISILPNEKYDLRYFYYTLPEQLLQNANENIYGAKMLNQELIRNAAICFPPKDEQTAIASFLDNKTAQIDKLIANEQKLIELLKEERTAIINHAVTKGINPEVKLKPSGIDWLGDIPAHWEMKKLKYVAVINPNKMLTNEEKLSEELITFLPMEKVSEDGNIDTSIQKQLNEVSNGFTYFEEGDVIVAKITPCFENGKGSLIKKLGSRLGFGSTEFHVLRAKERLLPEFIFFVTKSELFMNMGEAFMTGSAGQKRVPTNFVEDFLIGIPPLDEQRVIIRHIETHTIRLDATISKIEKEIELLQEYRTALISEVVTGKICVL